MKLPTIAILIIASIYFIMFGLMNISRVDHFNGEYGFDLSNQDQSIWLISRLETPFSTIRGLHVFGDHTPYIYLLIAPFYILYNSINVFLLFHSLTIASGSIGIYLIARKKLSGDYIAVIPALIYLFYPSTTFINIEMVFAETFAIPLLIFSFYFFIDDKPKIGTIFSSLALLCKEDAAVTVVMLAAYIFIFKNKKYGMILASIAIIWFSVNMFVLLPHFNGYGYFRNLYGYNAGGRLGSTPSQILNTVLTDQKMVYEIIFTTENKNYIIDTFKPLLFAPFLAPEILMIAAPTLVINIISGYYYTHFIKYHYTAYIIPFVIIATIYSISRLSKSKHLQICLLSAILASAAYQNYYMTQEISPTKPQNLYRLITISGYNDREIEMNNILDMIPPTSSVSAPYRMLMKLSHRKTIYMFPNPFSVSYWGINGENLPKDHPTYVIIDKELLDQQNTETVTYINSINEYITIYDSKDFAVLMKG